jgi:uroporphyrinogen decarboxylase
MVSRRTLGPDVPFLGEAWVDCAAMDSVTRLKTAIALEKPDRPPFTLWGHTFKEEWNPTELAAITVQRARRYRLDFVKLQPRATFFAEAYGSQYQPSGSDEEHPTLTRAGVETLEDWAKLPEVDASHPAFADQVEALRLTVAELGDKIPVIQTVFSPLTVAGHLIGKDPEGVVKMLLDHPDLLGPALARIARGLASFSTASVKAGGVGVFFAISGYASADMLSEEDYRRLALGHDLSVIELLPEDAWFNVAHLCGSRLHFDIAKALGLQAVSWDVYQPGNPTLAEGRDHTGMAAMGGLRQKTTLVKATPKEVIAEGQAALEGTDGRGVILAPGCSIDVHAGDDNLSAVKEVVAA